MLANWSSLSYSVGCCRSSGSGNSNSNNITPISPIAATVMLSLLTGNWGMARRLVFGQVLVGGQSNSDTSKNVVLIQEMNERAVDVLKDYVNVAQAKNEKSNNSEQSKRVALLYGAGHCHDLHWCLMDKGMVPIQTEEWRTPFCATAPRWGDYFEMEDWEAKSKAVTSS